MKKNLEVIFGKTIYKRKPHARVFNIKLKTHLNNIRNTKETSCN